MKVDTTVLGIHHLSKTVCLLCVVIPGHDKYRLGSGSRAAFCHWSLDNMQQALRLENKNAKIM